MQPQGLPGLPQGFILPGMPGGGPQGLAPPAQLPPQLLQQLLAGASPSFGGMLPPTGQLVPPPSFQSLLGQSLQGGADLRPPLGLPANFGAGAFGGPGGSNSLLSLLGPAPAQPGPLGGSVPPPPRLPSSRHMPAPPPSKTVQQEKAESQARMAEVEKMKCHLHKKPKNGCKFCKKHQDMLEDATAKDVKAKDKGGGSSKSRPGRAVSEERERIGPLEIGNPKTYGFTGLFQTHVVECAHFKSLLTLETFDALVDETYQFANSVEPYMTNSGTIPSALFCCLYRFFTMQLDAHSLKRLMNNQESPYIRCCGFLYARMGLPHDQILGWLGDYLMDDEEFKTSHIARRS